MRVPRRLEGVARISRRLQKGKTDCNEKEGGEWRQWIQDRTRLFHCLEHLHCTQLVIAERQRKSHMPLTNKSKNSASGRSYGRSSYELNRGKNEEASIWNQGEEA